MCRVLSLSSSLVFSKSTAVVRPQDVSAREKGLYMASTEWFDKYSTESDVLQGEVIEKSCEMLGQVWSWCYL